jgi:hypothetical protein
MSLRNYLLLCAATAATVVVVVLYVPGAAVTFEGLVLGFLSRNAG